MQSMQCGNPTVLQASEMSKQVELTSRKCEDILQGSTNLDSGDISSGVDPKVWTSKQTLQLSGKLLVLRRQTVSMPRLLASTQHSVPLQGHSVSCLYALQSHALLHNC